MLEWAGQGHTKACTCGLDRCNVDDCRDRLRGFVARWLEKALNAPFTANLAQKDETHERFVRLLVSNFSQQKQQRFVYTDPLGILYNRVSLWLCMICLILTSIVLSFPAGINPGTVSMCSLYNPTPLLHIFYTPWAEIHGKIAVTANNLRLIIELSPCKAPPWSWNIACWKVINKYQNQNEQAALLLIQNLFSDVSICSYNHLKKYHFNHTFHASELHYSFGSVINVWQCLFWILPEAGIFMIFILIFMITSCGALHLHFSSVQRVHDWTYSQNSTVVRWDGNNCIHMYKSW